jgi:hypothetical protein
LWCLCCVFVINRLWVIWCHQYSTQSHLDRNFVNFQSVIPKGNIWSSSLPVSVIFKARDFQIFCEFFQILILKSCNAMVLIKICMSLKLLQYVHSFTITVLWTMCRILMHSCHSRLLYIIILYASWVHCYYFVCKINWYILYVMYYRVAQFPGVFVTWHVMLVDLQCDFHVILLTSRI